MNYWPCKHIFLDPNGYDYYMLIVEETKLDDSKIVYKTIIFNVDNEVEECKLCNSRRPIPDILKLWCSNCDFYWTKEYKPEDKKRFGINPSREVKGACPKCRINHWDIWADNMPHTHDWPYESIEEIMMWESGDGARNEIESFNRKQAEKEASDKLFKFNQHHELQGEV